MRIHHLAFICLLVAAAVGVALNSSAAFSSSGPKAPITIEPLPDMPKGVYNLDPVHSSALFRVQHMGAGNFWGRFNDVNGTITFTPDDEKKTFDFNIDIPLESVDSGNEKLDRHLKSPDFFNAKEHEKMTFKSTEIERLSKDVWDITGDLTINGTTKPVVALVRFVGTADMGRGHRAGFEAALDIKRSDFKMNYGIENGMLGDMTHIVVAMEVSHDGS